jgi:biofilm PGA synthesis N-glycosyltransferase PgaC
MAFPLILLLFVYAYSLLILIFFFEMEPDPELPTQLSEQTRSVSVIVPFRNEADHLGELVEDLLAQSITEHLWELILVVDHSDDGSAAMVDSMIVSRKTFRCLSLPADLHGKKAALKCGIQEASNDWIIQVDADCRLGPDFLSSHLRFLEKYPSDLVAGLVTTGGESGGFLESFERLDLLSLAGSAAGSFGLGRPMMCSGANLSYSRQLYMDSRPFDPVASTPSGDDMFLMIAARKLGKKLSYHTGQDAMVRTTAAGDLPSMIRQRVRWGAKSGRYAMPDIQLFALLVSLANVTMFMMPLWFVLFSEAWPWLAGGCLFKTMADFFLLYRITGVTGQGKDLRRFVPVTLLYYPFFMVTLAGILLGKPEWKGDTR